MSTNIAFWAIFACNGKRHLTLPYNQRETADKLLSELNLNREKELYYCTVVKEAISELPKQLVKVDYDDRIVKIPFTIPETGETGMARKFFRDITVTSLVQGKYVVVETMTAHHYKRKGHSELRIKFRDESMNYADFEKLALERWPDGTDWVLMPILEL